MTHHAQVIRSRRRTNRDRNPFSPAMLQLPVLLSFALGLSSIAWMALSARRLEPIGSAPPQSVSVATAALPASGGASTKLAAATRLSTLFTPEVLAWRADILRWAEDHHLDPNLVAAVMQIESCGFPTARSSSGAMGLFQVMPFHFDSGENALDPDTNARRGLAYLARALQLAQGSTDLALAGYNGGHGVIERNPALWSPETQRYVRWGSGILDDIAAGRQDSPSLASWLQAGGSRLCDKAAEALALSR